MYNDAAVMMIFNTLTPTHPGSGTELSYVDMPIQRESHTGYPKIDAATLKGSLRFAAGQGRNGGQNADSENLDRLFGKQNKGDFASSISILDAKILFFPVKSARGILAWITCPWVLERFFRDYEMTFGKKFDGEWTAEGGTATSEVENRLGQRINKACRIMLEDYTYTVKKVDKFEHFMQRLSGFFPEDEILKDRLYGQAVILEDDDFMGFVKYSTEVSTRIRIDPETGTAAGNGLFTEEYLPPECILYSPIFFSDAHQAQGEEKQDLIGKDEMKQQFLKLFGGQGKGRIIQLGADTTLGKGFVRTGFWRDR